MTPSEILPKVLLFLASYSVAGAFSSRQCRRPIRADGGRPARVCPSTPSPLPLAATESVPAGERRPDPPRGKWILLVEDEDRPRRAAGEFLAEEGGYYVTGVSDARSAALVCRGSFRPDFDSNRSRFEFVGKRAEGDDSTDDSTWPARGPDCLVLDVQLGSGMSGLELMKIFRSSEFMDPDLPVVLLGDANDRISGYEAGADAYLSKPFDPYELLSIVEGLLARDKFSISGDGSRKTVDNGHTKTYEHLKRQLTEIKALLRELDEGQQSENSQGQVSVDSLHRDFMKMKEKIRTDKKHKADANESPPQPKKFDYDKVGALSVLTPEETVIVNLVARGMTNNEIATEMRCSASKIEKHMTAMFKKAAVRRRADLASWWKEHSREDAAKADEGDSRTGPKAEAASDETSPEADLSPALTTGERAVVELLAQGSTIEEIASRTKSTKRKVTKRMGDLFEKAHVESRTELVRWWRKSRGK